MATGAPLAATETVTIDTRPDRDVAVEALNHLVQGKRHLLVHDVPSAVDSLAVACRLLDACYGPLADECGDAYYNYGVALLEMSRRETGVLGNGKDGSGSDSDEAKDDEDDNDDDGDDDEDDDDKKEDDDDDDDDDDEEASGSADDDSKTTEKRGLSLMDQVATNGVDKLGVAEADSKPGDSEAKSENLEETEAADERKEDEIKSADVPVSETPSTSKVDLPSDTKITPPKEKPESSTVTCALPSSTVVDVPAVAEPEPLASSSITTTFDLAKPGTSSNNDVSSASKQAEDDEPSNLQLAWEVLEVAKIIFKRQTNNNPEMMLHLARVHSKLGEVSMESENYKQSIDDLLECLSMQRSLLPADDRLIAETYYQLGLAYSFDVQFDMSIGNFKNAIQVLKERISNLEKTVADNGGGGDKILEVESPQKEVEELGVLICDINDKIMDTEDMVKNQMTLPEVLADVVPVVKDSRKTPLSEYQVEVDSTTSSLPVPAIKPTFDIGHLVRKKRKTEDSEVSTSDAAELKRPRTETGTSAPKNAAESSGASSTNGVMISMDTGREDAINGTADSTATST